MQPVILFDIDHTLFDTKTWFTEFLTPFLAEVLETESENIAVIAGEYQASLEKHTDFNPPDFLQWLGEEFEVEPTTLQKHFFNPEFFKHSLFPDVLPCLNNLKDSYTLGIFSEGVKEWQRQKLELSGLMPFFSPQQTYILRRKSELDSLALVPESTIIDDRLDVVMAVAEHERLTPIWLNRQDQASDASITTIHSLDELVSVL